MPQDNEKKYLPLCPSAQPNMENTVVFGVIEGTVQDPRTSYLIKPQPLYKIANLSEPVKPTEVFRIAASCAEHQCVHFDGNKCKLAQKIAKLDAIVEVLPPCSIRTDCRWWQQEGVKACLRCPVIVTEHYQPSEELCHAADPMTEVI